MNVEKQVAHWLKSSKEDLEVADELLQNGRIRHGLFFLHLTLEKALKAIYSKRLAKVPPKIHTLDRLVEMCGLKITDGQMRIMAKINAFNLEGRYPEPKPIELGLQEVRAIREKGGEVYQWLIKQL